MGRPKSISDEAILKAAYDVFMEHGFQAPTSQIARAAGVSEGTVFKRFPTKAELFRSAMGVPQWDLSDKLERMVGEGEMRDQLVVLANELIDFFREMLPRVMALCTSPSTSASPMHIFQGDPDAPPLRMLKNLTNYFAAEMRAERICECDPEVAARIFLGSLHNFVFFELIGVHERMPFAVQTYVRALVDVVWRGLQPEQVSEHPLNN